MMIKEKENKIISKEFLYFWFLYHLGKQMTSTLPLEQRSKTGKLDAKLHQYILNSFSKFIEIIKTANLNQ